MNEDDRSLSGSGDEHVSETTVSSPWQNIFEQCRALGPDDDAWGSVDGFVEALRALADERLSERKRIRRERREAVAAARDRLWSLAGVLRTTPGSEGIAAEIDRVLAGPVSYEGAGEIVTASAAVAAVVNEIASLRAELVRRTQSWAPPEEMETLVHDLRAREADKVSNTKTLLVLLHAAATGPVLDETAEPEPEAVESVPIEPVSVEPVSMEPEPAPADEVAEATSVEQTTETVEPESAAPEARAPEPEASEAPETPETLEAPEAPEAAAPAPEPPPAESPRPVVRSRAEAETVYEDPLAALRDRDVIAAEARELAELWVANTKRPAHRDKLRRVFVEFLQDSTPGDGPLGTVESKQVVVSTAEACARLAAAGADANLVARLSVFEALTVMSAPMSDGLGAVAFAQNLLAFASSENGGPVFRIFLAPQLPKDWRDEALRRLRASGFSSAIVDDVDACRLITPGERPPNGLAALASIVFEQTDAAASA